ncbi:hypothetical protein HNP24_003952 [Chryseobacterium sediminis]|uniref:Cardiolipin synthase N-terminal domain-containing protein n=1 Tax=Chryseobacterium sediminis TaxID=1679494 RepID=A0ABR6Q595_9FLAO|nr:hypothetical protein [Chryseobacterium sediminis]
MLVTPYTIIFAAVVSIYIYIHSIIILQKKKSGILDYLIIFFIPYIGPIAIIISYYIKKEK